MKITSIIFLLATCCFLNIHAQSPLLELISAEKAGIDFKNTIKESSKYNHVMWDYVYNGAGVAVGDINNDGLPDICFSGNQVADRLYLNEGNFKFKDISQSLTGNANHTWSSGVTMADVNADGLLDIYICRFEPSPNKEERRNLLYINNGNLTFTERATEYGLADTGYSTQASFFDMDNDGDLDCYVVNQPPSNNLEKLNDRIKPGPCGEYTDKLYQNNGKNRFTDITKQAGIENCAYGLGIVVSDINNDGWQDIYISNDYFISDYCYINQKNGTFKDENKAYFKHQALYSMGVDVADFNNDGFVDVFAADMSAADHYRNKSNMASMNTQRFQDIVSSGNNHQFMFNALQLNNGNGTFSEIAHLTGVAQTDWSWSALWIDIDNDTNKDLFVTNGIKRDIRFVDGLNTVKELLAAGQVKLSDILNSSPSQKIENFAFKNMKDLRFKNMGKDWGFNIPSFSNGMAYSDLDKDGDLDLVVNNVEEAPFIFKNTTTNNFLTLKLKGVGNNTFGFGAKATIFYNKTEQQMLELNPTRGYLSASEPILNFGLGKIEQIDSLIVTWTMGERSKILSIKANQTLTIQQKEAVKTAFVRPTSPKNTFTASNKINFQHQEIDFNDFQKEVLLPNKMSQSGGAMSIADVNKDGLEDVFFGGGAGQTSQLFLQQTSGEFKKDTLVGENKAAEKVKSLFFDANNDGKLDLYVAHGSNEFAPNSPNLQDQLYLNTNGRLTHASDALPNMHVTTGAIAANDFDGDGDQDIFVGGMMEQQKYPYPARSYMLQNNKGKFTDITEKVAPELTKIGMVRDATWSDYDKDGDKDLIIVGEWMNIEIFNNNKGTLTKTAIKGIEKSRGMWHSIVAYDFDGDGDEDYMVGNLGQNNKFRRDSTKHFHVYSDDFDGNGINDIVLSKVNNGVALPVRGRECSSAQMPFVAQKFKTYDQFAKATLTEIYTPEKLGAALHYEMDEMGSIYLENKGKEGFAYTLLPRLAQLSVISDFEIGDFDKDGKIDVLAVGNKYEAEVETARYDASVGTFLKGDGKGHFQPVLARESGFSVPENARTIQKIKIKDKNNVLIGVDDGKTQGFSY